MVNEDGGRFPIAQQDLLAQGGANTVFNIASYMSRIAGSNSTTLSADRTVRIDTDHHLVELMQSAVDRLHGNRVDVQLCDEYVLLRGSVNSWSAKQSAQESIRRMSASRTIQNDLAVIGS